MEILHNLMHYWWVLALAIFLAGYKLTFRLFGVIIVPEGKLGIVNKKFVLFGTSKTLPDGKIIALNGEAGIQADTLAPGLHLLYWPWQYDIDLVPFTMVPSGYIMTVEAVDGVAMTNGRVLAKTVECDLFQNARAFLKNGGERGPQKDINPPGNYRINTKVFSLTKAEILEVPTNKIGVVTTLDGASLPKGEIAGPQIEGHNTFQNGQAFIAAGGAKGLQEQVILPGRYFINPRFAKIDLMDLTEVPIAHVGVVISYVGVEGKDVTGDTFKHGNLVTKGERGVWSEPLDPGKYPINPRTHRIELVSSANIVLNWAEGRTEAHNLDANLSTIKLRSADGFAFSMDVSQIIHVPRNDAPKVIARFGSMLNLVTQVLEPTIGNYFRNAAQGSGVLDFLTQRSQRQESAKERISTALSEYNVGAVDTLIGDIVPPEQLMKALTDRKQAEEEKTTFTTQRLAQEERQGLAQAQAIADTQAQVVSAERGVEIAEFNAKAAVKTAAGAAEAKEVNAKADAMVLKTVGDAEAGKILAVGQSEAEVIKKKTEAVGQGNYASIEIARLLSEGKVQLVPQILVNGGGATSNGGTMAEVLVASIMKDKLEEKKEEPAKK